MLREDESMSLKHHFHQLFKMKLRCLSSKQKWLVISLKVGSRKRHFLQSRLVHDKYGNAKKMSKLTPGERRKFLKSMDTEC